MTLTFDRAIDIGGPSPSVVSVWDGPVSYAKTGAMLVSAAVVRIDLSPNGNVSPDVPVLFANPANGIAPAGGGDPWEGPADLPLPYP